MELMSSLLLCAVVAFPPALAESNKIYAEFNTIRINNLTDFHPIPIYTNTLLGIRPSIIKTRIDMSSPFMDYACKPCFTCMERAVKDSKYKPRPIKKRPRFDVSEETLTLNEVARDKRELEFKLDETPLKKKRSKSKKTKYNKTVTVTKYTVDKQIRALKVKETLVASEQLDYTPASTTCQVYSVKKSYPCDSPESDLILAAARRKVNKKSKKEKEKVKATTSSTTTLIAPAFRKREVDNSQVPENFMPSIEELY